VSRARVVRDIGRVLTLLDVHLRGLRASTFADAGTRYSEVEPVP
jgi:hypothetical protein